MQLLDRHAHRFQSIAHIVEDCETQRTLVLPWCFLICLVNNGHASCG